MSAVKTHKVGIIMNGVTGRMGTNQHLMRSIKAIIDQGGVRLSDDETIMPDPVLVGRNPAKLEKLTQSDDSGHVRPMGVLKIDDDIGDLAAPGFDIMLNAPADTTD